MKDKIKDVFMNPKLHLLDEELLIDKPLTFVFQKEGNMIKIEEVLFNEEYVTNTIHKLAAESNIKTIDN